jgi:hypothetical protein
MAAIAATLAYSPVLARAVGLATAELASRRSEPVIRGRVMKRSRSLHSTAVKEVIPASPPAGPATLVDAPSGQLPKSMEQLS